MPLDRAPKPPMICTPSGNAPSSKPGTLTQGVPISVHSRLNAASPVEPRPSGAAPGADGARITSMSLMKSASARLAREAVRRAASYSSTVIAAARSRCSRNGFATSFAMAVVFERQCPKGFVVLNNELRAIRLFKKGRRASVRLPWHRLVARRAQQFRRLPASQRSPAATDVCARNRCAAERARRDRRADHDR